MPRRWAALALATFVACSAPGGGSSEPPAARVAEPDPGPSIAEREPLRPPRRLIVDNLATGKDERRLVRAIRDLKAVGLWRRLTEQLFVVEVSARRGRRFVPEDAHLADAFRTLDIRGDRGGVLCDITFYPTAMEDDLVRWTSYHERGLISDAPPTRRQLWAMILAHELAHCFKKRNDEEAAGRWEERALRRLRGAGIGDEP